MNTLASFLNVHAGGTIIVCGCGQSLNQLQRPEEFVTIGVNDVGRKFQPDYLVVVNPPHQFSGDRFRYVEGSQAKFIFTQLELGLTRDNVVKFSLGTQGGTDFSNPDVLNYTQNSPYVALCLAIHMGARRIGLLGVDFTDDHFFGPTGVHSLSSQLTVIDQQYRRLYDAARARGVEIYNLSESSRLTAFPKITEAKFKLNTDDTDKKTDLSEPRVFVVNYNFLTCGDVFGTGLSNAAKQLGLEHQVSLWDAPDLSARIERFQPDLIFVVHGRRFAEKWKGKFNSWKTAVWLVDEPYEVDDTVRWSSSFDTVFINDPNTLTRHPNAHYLPVCFDPATHCDPGTDRSHAVGFIGGYNETRNQYLNEMAKAGMLSYVAGGPWKSKAVQQLSIGPKVSPAQTTALYQDTSVVLNVFRDIHHFNGSRIPARSMNPRIYEALACGALVVSEEREEIRDVFPELPTFSNSRSLLTTLEKLLADERATRGLLQKNRARLQGHTYADRLAKVLQVCLGWQKELRLGRKTITEWVHIGDAARIDPDEVIEFNKQHDDAPGSETGLASNRAYTDVELSFDLCLDDASTFIAKVHQSDQQNQQTNSYHLFVAPHAAYAARHNHVFKRVPIARGAWQSLTLRRSRSNFEVHVNGASVVNVVDEHIKQGYCFLGVKGGRAKLRNVRLVELLKPVVHTNGNGTKQPGAHLWPFTATPKRNLLYHIWPVRGTMWKWNLDELLKRIDLFNGRRIMSIVHDERSVTPEEVQQALAGHGFEFVVARNDERGEAINYAEMLRRVASQDTNEISFYGHAKGVKYDPDIPLPIRRWTEVQYQVVLDDWLTIREQLQRYAMTGPFKRYGKFDPHHNLADWHYSGTYFWMRHSHLFARDYQNIPQFYGGVETWPGTVFRKEETGCVFIDDLGPSRSHHPYYPEFWRTAEPALRRWQASVRTFPPPRDLVTPRPLKDDAEHLTEQKPEEFQWLLDLLLKENVDRLLVVGSHSSGLEWHIARQFFAHQRRIEITTIKRASDPRIVEDLRSAEQNFGQPITSIVAESLSSARAQLAPQYTAVFLDGDHGYKGCRTDFDLALTLNPRLIALHDIVDSDWHAYARCCVSRVWNELKDRYRTLEKSSDEWAGIGVVMLDK
jgi:glycosyl transferase family 1